MSYLALSPAPFDDNDNTINKKKKKRDRKVDSIIKEIQEDNDGDELENFTSSSELLAPPQIQTRGGSSREKESDDAIKPESFDSLSSVDIPYYTQMSAPSEVKKDELLLKLDKILTLLEEQRDEKTGHVTEEVILFSFIGIFIIFVVDSFARAGKYVR